MRNQRGESDTQDSCGIAWIHYSTLRLAASRWDFGRWKFLLLLREPWPDLIPIFNSANLHESRAPVWELLVSIEGVNVRYTVGIPHAILSGITWWTCWKIVLHSPRMEYEIIRGEIIPFSQDIVASLFIDLLTLSNGIGTELSRESRFLFLIIVLCHTRDNCTIFLHTRQSVLARILEQSQASLDIKKRKEMEMEFSRNPALFFRLYYLLETSIRTK